MLGLIGSRLLQLIVVSFFVLSILFVLVRMIGDPAAMRLGPEATQEDVQKLRHYLGLDRPMYVQYGEFMWMKLPRWTTVGTNEDGTPKKGFKVLDFGKSFESGKPALFDILRRVPYSMMLSGVAFLFAAIFSIPLGILAARYRNKVWGWMIMGFTLTWQCTPNFVLALVLILAFSVTWQILPSFGFQGPQSIVLPAIALTAFPLARLTRLIRGQMLEVMSQDYIRTARSKGLSEPVVTYRHGLRNAMIPWATMAGIDFALMMGGSLIIEQIFLWPGVGRGIMEAVTHRDYPTLESGAFFLTTMVVLGNMMVDISYRYLDPRIGWTTKKR